MIEIVELPSKRRRISRRKGGRKKVRERTATWYKKKADSLFSLFIRQKYADKDGNIKCYTCPTIRPIKKMQNGHFISRRYLGTRYEEKNCRPQCWYCNGHGYGNGRPVEFATGLKAEYGAGIVEELYNQAAPVMHDFDFQAVIHRYTKNP